VILRVGLVSTAHVHTPSYAHQFSNHSRAVVVGVWDDDHTRGEAFATERSLRFFTSLDSLLNECDAVAISSENSKHLEHISVCARAGKAIICEKPVVVRHEDFQVVRDVVEQTGIKFMTAFPCRFSPVWRDIKAKLATGELGEIKAINATNRGQCPQSWFVKPELSGGGAMIDHVVHVADLLKDLFGTEPERVYAQIGSNIYGGANWDDTAMLTLDYPGNVFVTLDSSWSRPKSYKTWGDVTMKIVCSNGVLNVDMFGQGYDSYTNSSSPNHQLCGYGSDLDGAMMDAFVRCCLDQEPIPVTLDDGLAAVKVSLKAYEAVRESQPANYTF
jgi:predicted dehydrogenase